ncbi:MAG: DUF3696 domain-containing protein [Clostridium sp.]|nr:DUF3696 domain-containing protein [Clostridium sp.]
MLQTLRIQNFKLHEDTTIEFGGLTILTGINGMGKSTILQSLLLLRQSFLAHRLKKGLNLRGELADLGVSGKLACQMVDSDELKLDLNFETISRYFSFLYPEDGMETYLPLAYEEETSHELDIDEEEFLYELAKQNLFSTDFQYISAFRFGPMKTYGRDSAVVGQDKQISKSQGKCEYTVHFLYQFKNMKILKELSLPDSNGNYNYQLGNQVELWLQAISPKIHLNIEPSGEDFKLNYKFDRENNFATEEMSAVNTGFGISYLLPILVGILSARPGAMILIENPEAHVHPKGQSVLMELVTKAVKAGIQIVIETHSDHIINGALVNVKRGFLPDTLVSVYFFNRDEERHIAQPHRLEVTASGQIKRPPKDFFDQMQIDLRVLTGIDK